jgi:hypothetical protein
MILQTAHSLCPQFSSWSKSSRDTHSRSSGTGRSVAILDMSPEKRRWPVAPVACKVLLGRMRPFLFRSPKPERNSQAEKTITTRPGRVKNRQSRAGDLRRPQRSRNPTERDAALTGASRPVVAQSDESASSGNGHASWDAFPAGTVRHAPSALPHRNRAFS